MRSKMCDEFATPHSALQRRWKMSDVRCMMSDVRWKMWLCAAFFILHSSLFTYKEYPFTILSIYTTLELSHFSMRLISVLGCLSIGHRLASRSMASAAASA